VLDSPGTPHAPRCFPKHIRPRPPILRSPANWPVSYGSQAHWHTSFGHPPYPSAIHGRPPPVPRLPPVTLLQLASKSCHPTARGVSSRPPTLPPSWSPSPLINWSVSQFPQTRFGCNQCTLCAYRAQPSLLNPPRPPARSTGRIHVHGIANDPYHSVCLEDQTLRHGRCIDWPVNPSLRSGREAPSGFPPPNARACRIL
jgi:hypothetical protein